jgi:superfamily II DNA/RNA helicase
LFFQQTHSFFSPAADNINFVINFDYPNNDIYKNRIHNIKDNGFCLTLSTPDNMPKVEESLGNIKDLYDILKIETRIETSKSTRSSSNFVEILNEQDKSQTLLNFIRNIAKGTDAIAKIKLLIFAASQNVVELSKFLQKNLREIIVTEGWTIAGVSSDMFTNKSKKFVCSKALHNFSCTRNQVLIISDFIFVNQKLSE